MKTHYSGEIIFDYEVVRFLNKETNILSIEADNSINHDSFEEEPQFILLEITGEAYISLGKFYGPWENCYPDDDEVEIISILGPNQEDWSKNLSDKEQKDILDSLLERACNESINYLQDR